MVKSDKIFSPQLYVEAVTGNYYIFPNDGLSYLEIIRKLLEENCLDHLWDYPFKEIDHIVENNLDVVLVDCGEYADAEHGVVWVNDYRWFEVPEDFTEEVD